MYPHCWPPAFGSGSPVIDGAVGTPMQYGV